MNISENNTDNITWLAKNSEELSKEELFEWLTTTCKPEQTGIIMGHIELLSENMMIGYDDKDVFVMFVDEDEYGENKILKISKKI